MKNVIDSLPLMDMWSTVITGPSFLRGTLALGAYGNLTEIRESGWKQPADNMPTLISQIMPDTDILIFANEETFSDYLIKARYHRMAVRVIVTEFEPDPELMYYARMNTDAEEIWPEVINKNYEFMVTHQMHGQLEECFTGSIVDPEITGYIITPI